jgi:hypothetical protein
MTKDLSIGNQFFFGDDALILARYFRCNNGDSSDDVVVMKDVPSVFSFFCYSNPLHVSPY